MFKLPMTENFTSVMVICQNVEVKPRASYRGDYGPNIFLIKKGNLKKQRKQKEEEKKS